MSETILHRGRNRSRIGIASVMLLTYLLVSLSPLASLVLQSKSLAHAITGECSGDCSICGCSLESRATESCCCSKKRHQQAQLHSDDDEDTPECCRKERNTHKTIIACGSPCGSRKIIALSTSGSFEILPYRYSHFFAVPLTVTIFSNPVRQLTSRFEDPPDPPPKISYRS